MLIELFEGFFVNPDKVAAVKATGKGRCALFMAGQSAVDGGFTLPYSAKKVVKALDAVEEEDEGEEEGDDEE